MPTQVCVATMSLRCEIPPKSGSETDAQYSARIAAITARFDALWTQDRERRWSSLGYSTTVGLQSELDRVIDAELESEIEYDLGLGAGDRQVSAFDGGDWSTGAGGAHGDDRPVSIFDGYSKPWTFPSTVSPANLRASMRAVCTWSIINVP